MGRYTAEALGDHGAGPNHVLLILCTARFFAVGCLLFSETNQPDPLLAWWSLGTGSHCFGIGAGAKG